MCINFVKIISNVSLFALQKAADHASESEEDDIIGRPTLDAAGDQLPQGSDKTTEAIDSALKDLTPRSADKQLK